MNHYPLEIFDGHPIFQEGEHTILIDTGSPVTVHREAQLLFLGAQYTTHSRYAGASVEDLSGMVGKSITTLLGMDILSRYTIILDYDRGVVGFDRAATLADAAEIPLLSFGGIPMVEISVGGQSLDTFLDSGAKLSYLPEAWVRDLQPIGREQDFYPVIGPFETAVYVLETELGGESFPVKYGVLPSALLNVLALARDKGILGFDFFKQYRVGLDMEGKRLTYRRNGH